MATQYNNTFVDERYSKIVEPNLYGDAILQPARPLTPSIRGTPTPAWSKSIR